MSNYIHLTVATICKKDGRFLMVEEQSKTQDPTHQGTSSQNSKSLKPNVINQPAGHVELNESIYDAAIRETLEETAWSVIPKYIVGIYHNLNSIQDVNSRQFLRICFYCDLLEKKDLDLDPDIIATHWLTADEILKHPHPRSPMVHASLNDYLSDKKISLDILSTLS
jgi:8-oxo-dGTP pyrophosphatase MutT (NUDIX family)